jgi:hypothetical protein
MDDKRNGSGYVDPTATEAIANVDKEEERFKRLFGTIRYICEMANFKIEGRIVLVDKETGKVWR